PPWVRVTGFWFLDRAAEWRPPPDLAAFLEAGPAPVAISFGSMITARAEELTDLVLAALARCGRRGLLLTSWGGLVDRAPSGDVHVAPEVPHDWLFPRVAAVVHHGGAGTSAAVLRAGVPSVVVPFQFDQRYWGERARSLGTAGGVLPRS